MKQSTIDNLIYEKYIAPTRTKTKRFIGIEIEMPVINLNKLPVEEEVIFKLSAAFRERFGFRVIGRDAEGNVNSMQDDVTGDDLSFDCCYSNLELSLGKGKNLHEIKERFDKYYTFINEFLSEYNYTLTGMGINPYYNINHRILIPRRKSRLQNIPKKNPLRMITELILNAATESVLCYIREYISTFPFRRA